MKTFAIQDLIYNNIKSICRDFERAYSKNYLRLPIYGQWANLNPMLNWCRLSEEFMDDNNRILSVDITSFEYFKIQLEYIKKATEECIELEK
jgi:hypothetical protein